MNAKRIIFWLGFVIVLTLIVWGLIVAMNKPAGEARLSAPADITSSDHVRGPANAPVTLIEYSDFQCPACELYYPIVTKLLAEYGTTTVKFVYRHFPLDNQLPDGTIQHPNAMAASLASEAAGAQGKFWDMYDLLFTNHADWTELKDPTDTFVGYATKIGLNADRFKADLASSTLKDYVQANKDDGIKIGINSTPTFFVNGKAIANPQGYEQFKSIIDAAASGGAK